MAIIVVLAAVAIPTFGRQLETSRETADMELVRSAYTEALSLASLDAADGKLDGQNGGTVFSTTATDPVFTTSDDDDDKQSYTVLLSAMATGAAMKQTNAGFQYVDKKVAGVEVPATIDRSITKVTFAFELNSGTVKLADSSGITVAS